MGVLEDGNCLYLGDRCARGREVRGQRADEVARIIHYRYCEVDLAGVGAHREVIAFQHYQVVVAHWGNLVLRVVGVLAVD